MSCIYFSAIPSSYLSNETAISKSISCRTLRQLDSSQIRLSEILSWVAKSDLNQSQCSLV